MAIKTRGHLYPRLRRVQSTLPALSLLIYLFLSEPPSVLLLFFSALALHEWGHLCAFALVGGFVPTLSLSGVGMRLRAPFPLLPREELLVALAGPLCNLLFAFFALRLGEGDFFLLFAAVHVLFALGNLLPFGKSDGERMLSLLLRTLSPVRGERILHAVRVFFLALFFYFSLFLFYLSGAGLCGILFSVFFLSESKKDSEHLF